MVTNDKFRDYLDAIDQDLKTQESSHQHIDKSSAKKSRDWIKAHSVSYTFNKDEFLPNPQAKIW